MNINFSALSRDITDQELQANKQQLQYKVLDMAAAQAAVVAILVFIMFAAFLLPLFIQAGTVGIIIAIIVVCGGIVGGVLAFKGWIKKALVRRMRLQLFAKDNGLSYASLLYNPAHRGIIFDIGDTRISQDIIYSNKGELFEIGNYRYSTGGGKSRHTSYWGYVCIELDRNVPNMVLDAKGNDTHLFGIDVSDLPVTYKKDQRLSLEGDFDKYFTLYAPAEYKTDALYIFTPDLMALLIDDVAQFDVEIVDNRMYVYHVGTLNLLDQKMMERLFTIIQTVGARVDSRTDNYADERIGNRAANIIAPQGTRLKRSVPILAIVIFALVVIFQVVLPLLLAH